MPARRADELATIKRRLVETLIRHAQDGHPDWIQEARRDRDRLRADGRWPDIDYGDQSMMGEWQVARHLGRMGRMAAASRLRGQVDAALSDGVLAVLDAWLRVDFTNPNWWWNEIGVPQALGHVMILLEDRLTPTQLAAGLKIMGRNNWSKHTGQNLVWGTGIQIVRGALAGDSAVVAKGFIRTAREIRIAGPGEEGIQADYSFHQHGAVLYSGGYGLNFAGDAPAFAALARGTGFAFSPAVVRRLSAYLLDGEQWMVRGSTFDYTAVGREITRRGKSAAGLAAACRDMMLVDPGRRAEFAAFQRRLLGQAGPRDAWIGNRHFWKSDLMTHHRRPYSASVRLFSNRLDNTDWVCGGEGKKSHYLADGAMYLYRRGDEYRDLFPAWDWRRVPGITVEYLDPHPAADTVRTRGTRSFAGGVSDGRYGLAAMDFARGALRAKKAWFFFDREIVCLGAGIASWSGRRVLTSVNQCHAHGTIVEERAGRPCRLPRGLQRRRGPTWIHHDGTGYLFPGTADLRVGCAVQAGDWADIGTGTGGKVSWRVFSLWLEHGRRVKGGAYGYVIVPGIPAAEMARYVKPGPVVMLANTARQQAVWHAGAGVLQAAFYRAGRLKWGDLWTLAVDRPCLVLARRRGRMFVIAVADPTGQQAAVRLEISLRLRGRGCRWLPGRRTTQVTLRLSRGANAGRSVAVVAAARPSFRRQPVRADPEGNS